MAALATLEELTSRLDWTLDEQEQSMAEGALDDASALVRHYGLGWEPENVPPVAKTIALAAARRFVVNNMGVTVSRAGDETLGWDGVGDKAGSVYLTDEEKSMLGSLARGTGFGTIPVSSWGTRIRDRREPGGYVATEGGRKPFPWFNDPVEPW
jgi:hypothetical protein